MSTCQSIERLAHEDRLALLNLRQKQRLTALLLLQVTALLAET